MSAAAVLLLVDAALCQTTVDPPIATAAVLLLVIAALCQTTADPLWVAPLTVHLTSTAAPGP